MWVSWKLIPPEWLTVCWGLRPQRKKTLYNTYVTLDLKRLVLIKRLTAIQMLHSCILIFQFDDMHLPSAQLHSALHTAHKTRQQLATHWAKNFLIDIFYIATISLLLSWYMGLPLQQTKKCTKSWKYALAAYFSCGFHPVHVYLSVYVCKRKRETPPTWTYVTVRTQRKPLRGSKTEWLSWTGI